MLNYKKSFSMKSDFPENKQIPNPVDNATTNIQQSYQFLSSKSLWEWCWSAIGLAVSGQAPSAGKLQKDFRVAPGPADGASTDSNL
jgi:hypothetical protein